MQLLAYEVPPGALMSRSWCSTCALHVACTGKLLQRLPGNDEHCHACLPACAAEPFKVHLCSVLHADASRGSHGDVDCRQALAQEGVQPFRQLSSQVCERQAHHLGHTTRSGLHAGHNRPQPWTSGVQPVGDWQRA